MRGRLGFFRLWLAGSIFWAIYCAWTSDIACPLQLIGIETGAGPWCEYQNAEPLKYYMGLIGRMVGPPIVIGAVMLAVGWVVSGFKKPHIVSSKVAEDDDSLLETKTVPRLPPKDR
jgi:hypothetical protein